MSESVPRDQLRASDADREEVVERLREAHGEGRLDLAELDERIVAAYAARTYGDLAKITEDLPAPSVPTKRAAAPRRPEQATPERRDGTNRGLQAAFGAWLAVSVVNVVIWAIVSISSAHFVYPWWIWVAGPLGAVLLAAAIGQRFSRS